MGALLVLVAQCKSQEVCGVVLANSVPSMCQGVLVMGTAIFMAQGVNIDLGEISIGQESTSALILTL